MGLHTGQAVASDGRYTGLAVHRAARIGAAGHGGQILLSQATQTLLEDEEEDLLGALAAALRSRGTVSALNFPAGEPVATALREAGAEVRLCQYEMVLPL